MPADPEHDRYLALALLREGWAFERDAARKGAPASAKKKWEAWKWENAPRLMAAVATLLGVDRP